MTRAERSVQAPIDPFSFTRPYVPIRLTAIAR